MIVTLGSCMLKPIVTTYNYQQHRNDDVSLQQLGGGKVLFYNAANILHKMDNTARLNMWIDDLPMGQFRPGEYAIMRLSKGEHIVKLLHVDVFTFRSTHSIVVNDDTKVICLKPMAMDNLCVAKDELPHNFQKYKYVSER